MFTSYIDVCFVYVKVIARWLPDEAQRPTVDEAPVFSPSLEVLIASRLRQIIYFLAHSFDFVFVPS